MGGENLDESDLFYFFWRGNQSDLANHKQVHSKHRLVTLRGRAQREPYHRLLGFVPLWRRRTAWEMLRPRPTDRPRACVPFIRLPVGLDEMCTTKKD